MGAEKEHLKFGLRREMQKKDHNQHSAKNSESKPKVRGRGAKLITNAKKEKLREDKRRRQHDDTRSESK